MEDYIHYLDSAAISLGDLHFSNGDYFKASIAYSKALNQLQKYNGDSMVAIETAAYLSRKIKECNSKSEIPPYRRKSFSEWSSNL